jgi:hypothetical protein
LEDFELRFEELRQKCAEDESVITNAHAANHNRGGLVQRAFSAELSDAISDFGQVSVCTTCAYTYEMQFLPPPSIPSMPVHLHFFCCLVFLFNAPATPFGKMGLSSADGAAAPAAEPDAIDAYEFPNDGARTGPARGSSKRTVVGSSLSSTALSKSGTATAARGKAKSKTGSLSHLRKGRVVDSEDDEDDEEEDEEEEDEEEDEEGEREVKPIAHRGVQRQRRAIVLPTVRSTRRPTRRGGVHVDSDENSDEDSEGDDAEGATTVSRSAVAGETSDDNDGLDDDELMIPSQRRLSGKLGKMKLESPVGAKLRAKTIAPLSTPMKRRGGSRK